jgi:peptidoglycan/LPS O-acetylase OafA/YrhL
LVNPVTRFTGKISYSMYFVHFAILNFFARFHFWGLSKYKVVGTLVALLIVFLSTMIISTLTYYLVEKKGIALGSFIISRIENKRLLKKHAQGTHANP